MMSGKGSVRSARGSGTRRWLPLSVPAAAASIVCLLIVPAGFASHARTPMAPPFSGTISQPQQQVTASCGTASGKVAHWVGSTGLVTAAAKATFKKCVAWQGTENGFAAYYDTIGIPIKIPTNSVYNVSVSVSYHLASSMSVTSGGFCPAAANYSSGYDYSSCTWHVGWDVLDVIGLFDVTNNTWVNRSFTESDVGNLSEYDIDNDCVYGSCASGSTYITGSSAADRVLVEPGYDLGGFYASPGASSGTFSMWTNSSNYVYHRAAFGGNTTLLSSHKYLLIQSVYFEAGAYSTGDSAGYTGSTTFNILTNQGGFGTVQVSGLGPTDGLKTTSVTVTAV